MTSVVLAMENGLLRGALSYVLRSEGVQIAAEVEATDGVLEQVRQHRPDVLILDLTIVGADGAPVARSASEAMDDRGVLFLVDPRHPEVLRDTVVDPLAAVGFLPLTVSLDKVVDSVHRLARGEPVLDGELVVAALRSVSPLTARESQVLRAAAEGRPTSEIAVELELSPGTVRNHLSRIMAKTGARTRIEAVHIAREAGWI